MASPSRSVNPEISPEVETILIRALEKAPQDRYQTGVDLMEALEKALKGKPGQIPLPPVPVGVPTVRRAYSHTRLKPASATSKVVQQAPTVRTQAPNLPSPLPAVQQIPSLTLKDRRRSKAP